MLDKIMLNTYNNHYKTYLYIYYASVYYNSVRVIEEIVYTLGYRSKYLESAKDSGDVLRNGKMTTSGFIFWSVISKRITTEIKQ